jgi:hypothetical protein
VRRCLEFVGEPFDEVCLKPLRERINASVIPPNSPSAPAQAAPKYILDAIALYESLSSGEFERVHTPLRALRTLASSIRQQVRALESERMQALLKKHQSLMWKNRSLSTKLDQAKEQLRLLRSASGVRSLVQQVSRAFGKRIVGK